MQQELTELQKRLLPMLAWFHNFCITQNLQYYLLGGTMLGAARHQGFIPWDDDIDVGMPREDYERFLIITKNQKFKNYLVEGIDTNNKDYYYGYSKIYDTGTTLVENTRYQIKRGIYIDVFPIDGVAKQKDEVDKVFNPIYWRYQLLLARTCSIRPNRKWYKNLGIYMARIIPEFFINNKKLMLSIDEMCKEREFAKCLYVGNFYGNWGKREIVRKEVMGTPKLYNFENMEVFGVTDYDGYLTSLYGDWRKLPPKNKQITHHDYLYIDLNNSYLS